MSRIAICYCGKPVVSTMHFSGAEYYCIDCGAQLGMFDAERVESTPRLDRLKANRDKKWESVASKLITPNSWRRSCDKCDSGKGEYHYMHTTLEEQSDNEVARKKLKGWLR